MELFTIDNEKCNGCGICVQECPVKIIELKDGAEYPSLLDGGIELCINCGHCVAVCPDGAFTHRSMSPYDCLEIKRDHLPDPEQMELFLRNRRSIRTYKEKSVEKSTLEEIIKIASYAPSGHNSQSVNWSIIYNRSEIQKLNRHVVDWMNYMIKEQPQIASMLHLDLVVKSWDMGIDTICRDAPHVVLAHCHTANPMGQTSATLAMSYFELAVSSFGLGGCWAGYFNIATSAWPPMKEALGLGDDQKVHGAMMVGYPKFKYKRLPLRNNPKINWM